MTTNPLRGEVTVGDTDLVLVFDVNALCLAEEALGMTTDAIVQDFQAMCDAMVEGQRGALNLRLLRALFWAGLQRHRSCEMDEAARLMPVPLSIAQNAIVAALLAAFGGAEGGEDSRPPRKGKASTG